LLRTRVITAVALLLVLAAAAAISLEALIALGAAFLGVALYECLRLARIPSGLAAWVAAAAALFSLALDLAGLRPAPMALLVLCGCATAAWMGIGWLLVRAQAGGVRIAPAALVVGAIALSGVAWLALAALLREGPLWLLSVLVLVWLADIAAYFCGRAFGKRKLADRISPGKTWAGVWGAMVAVLAVAEAVRWAWPQLAAWSTRLLVAAPAAGLAVLLALVALSIVGDLFESLVKRQAGVKDSGWVLPGHGGVWDRIDATLPVLPLAVVGQWLWSQGASHG
jgi:phosphatidate cytidylyltransferase